VQRLGDWAEAGGDGEGWLVAADLHIIFIRILFFSNSRFLLIGIYKDLKGVVVVVVVVLVILVVGVTMELPTCGFEVAFVILIVVVVVIVGGSGGIGVTMELPHVVSK
jgi:hypothetical protein